MLEIVPSEVSTRVLHGYLLTAVAPRPIAFASTIDGEGKPNLAPFSFFNAFSANPPIMVFSPALSGRTGEPKHTYLNVKEVPEVVINIVDHELVHQMSLASTEYEKGISEFEKAGLTPVKSDTIKPMRVAEAKVQMECKVNEVIELGTAGGAGNLIICELLKMHIDESILDDQQKIDTRKLDVVGRMGGNTYVRANHDALFEITKPIGVIGIGIDALPDHIRTHENLTGNELAQLGGLERLPTQKDIDEVVQRESDQPAEEVLLKAKTEIQIGNAWNALCLLMTLG